MAEPSYWLTAKICEPNYAAERTFLVAETAFVERKLDEHRARFWRRLSLPSLGMFGHKDWRSYKHKLEDYESELKKYEHEVEDGILPVKFAVYHAGRSTDTRIKLEVRVSDGKIDSTRKAPHRPPRLDAPPKRLRFTWPYAMGFWRRGIKITPHHISAELSKLGPEDSATLINQLVHIHCGPETRVSYTVTSTEVDHETGDVELHNAATETELLPE